MKNREQLEGIAGHISSILRLTGFSIEQDKELAKTPERVAEMLLDLVPGEAGSNPPPITLLENPNAGQEMLVVQGMEFHSICVHHLLPFFGHAHIGYIADGQIIGLGSLGRLLDHFSRRPQLQERLTGQLASHLMAVLKPHGVIVLAEARQLCMELGGARMRARVDTVAVEGCFSSSEMRQEFLSRLERSRD